MIFLKIKTFTIRGSYHVKYWLWYVYEFMICIWDPRVYESIFVGVTLAWWEAPNQGCVDLFLHTLYLYHSCHENLISQKIQQAIYDVYCAIAYMIVHRGDGGFVWEKLWSLNLWNRNIYIWGLYYIFTFTFTFA